MSGQDSHCRDKELGCFLKPLENHRRWGILNLCLPNDALQTGNSRRIFISRVWVTPQSLLEVVDIFKR